MNREKAQKMIDDMPEALGLKPVEYLGLAHIKCEGAPLHPDDMNCVSAEHYIKQLKAYIKFMVETDNGTSEYIDNLKKDLKRAECRAGINNG